MKAYLLTPGDKEMLRRMRIAQDDDATPIPMPRPVRPTKAEDAPKS